MKHDADKLVHFLVRAGALALGGCLLRNGSKDQKMNPKWKELLEAGNAMRDWIASGLPDRDWNDDQRVGRRVVQAWDHLRAQAPESDPLRGLSREQARFLTEGDIPAPRAQAPEPQGETICDRCGKPIPNHETSRLGKDGSHTHRACYPQPESQQPAAEPHWPTDEEYRAKGLEPYPEPAEPKAGR